MCDPGTDLCSLSWKPDQKRLVPHFSYCTRLSSEIQHAMPQELTLSVVRSLAMLCGEQACLWKVLQDLIGQRDLSIADLRSATERARRTD